MKLQQGVTGFDASTSLEFQDLDGVVSRVKQLKQFKVLFFLEPSPGNNFYRIGIEGFSGVKIEVLVNAIYPLFCGVKDGASLEKEFLELPEEVKVKFQKRYSYLTPEYLNSCFTATDIDVLSNVEKEQVSYWGSKTFGEVIFNCFD